MPEWIKENITIKIAAGVCVGLVAARILLHILSVAYERLDSEWNGNAYTPLLTISIAVFALLSLIIWQRKHIVGYLRNHKNKLAGIFVILIVGVLFAASRGGKTYTAIAASGGSDDDARLAANQIAVMYLAAYLSTLLFLTSGEKMIRAVWEKSRDQQRTVVDNHSDLVRPYTKAGILFICALSLAAFALWMHRLVKG